MQREIGGGFKDVRIPRKKVTGSCGLFSKIRKADSGLKIL
jgi:hypothetical protein